MNRRTAVLECAGLRVQRNQRWVLDGLDLQLAAGELVVLCTRGRDKPTEVAAALTSAGRYRVQQGKLLVGGANVGGLDAMQRARSGMILTDPQRSVAGVTVTNHLRIALQEQHHNVGPQILRKRLLEALQVLGLDNHFAGRTLPEALPFADGLRLVLLTVGVVQPLVAIFPVSDSAVDLDAVRLLVAGLQQVERGPTAVVLLTRDDRLTQELVADHKFAFEAGQIVGRIAVEPLDSPD